MRELGRFFSAYCAHKHTSWAKYVPMIQECLNLTFDHTTNAIPHVLHFRMNLRDRLVQMFPMLKKALNTREIQLQLAILRVPHLSDKAEQVTSMFFLFV